MSILGQIHQLGGSRHGRGRRRRPWISVFALGVSVALLPGCFESNVASQVAQSPEFAPKDHAKCRVGTSPTKPFVVEWPSADRAELEAQTRKGPVAVHYENCDMEILRHCQAPGRYAYAGVTRQDDRVTIKEADELYAKIPVHAAEFEGKLQKAGELNVEMSIVGTYALDRSQVRSEELQGDCARATHILSALTVGSFEFFAGAAAHVSGEVEVAVAGVGARSDAKRETLNRAGDRATCGGAATKDTGPPEGCGAFVRVEATPIVTPNPFSSLRSWKGHYVCAGDRTQLAVQVENVAGNQVDALFEFRSGDGETVGKFHAHGSYAPGSKSIKLAPGDWIEQPSGWIAVGLSGKVDEAGETFSGKMDNAQCGDFSLTRVR